jgi:hypothetical protein
LHRPAHYTCYVELVPKEGVSGGDEYASTYYVPATQRRPPPASEGSERANVLALRVGIFQYNNVLVPTVRRVARMRRHLASIGTTYRYRQLYDVYEESAEDETSRVQFRRLDASQESPCTGVLQYIIIIISVHQTASL